MLRECVVVVMFLSVFGCAASKPVVKIEMGGRGVASESACIELGGAWVRAGMADTELCMFRPTDAGKRCNSNDQCQTLCVAEAEAIPGEKAYGHCFSSSITLGSCIAMISKGVVRDRVCID